MDGPVSGRKGMSIRWFLTTLALSIAGSVAHADLQDTVGQVKKSIVIVGTFRATDSPRFNLRGTGFVAGNGKQVVTNAHVLPEGNDALQERSLVVQIRDANGEWQIRKAYVGAMDSVHDLVVLKIDGDPIAALNVRDSGGVREGQSVAFMGFPIGGALGFAPVTHRATISAITPAAMPTPTADRLNEKAIRSLRAGAFDIFQLDGTAYPGNSGGPLFDPDSGDVLGVLNMVYIKGTRESALSNPSGISYAIPSKFVNSLLQRLSAD
jgi:serine protease Do